ncbi:hypothetical protein [Flavobacterium sp.]|uniref:hypothetical protein n=1 Tax=Flavobacterium sp. TaxID=239 RepID=UPI003D6AAB63
MNSSTTNKTAVLPPLKLVQISRLNEQAIPLEGLLNPEWLISPLISAEEIFLGDVRYWNIKMMVFLPDELDSDSFELFDNTTDLDTNLVLLLKYKKTQPDSKSYFAWYICYEYLSSEDREIDIKGVTVSVENDSIDNGNPRTSRGTVTQIIQSY